ncbi:putative nucleotidyl transferase [Clostridium botulinum C str. Eklund]|nr:putative nucleotidyl transferase [Clostridium botulinum C str. Eklund]NEZ48436.1 phosphocholine cytidylyltransferase family protein [Clostridium botulinum]
MKIKQAVILAAGMGSRLRPLTNDIPKCLVKVSCCSILENALIVLNDIGIENVVIVTGYLHEKIEHQFNDKFLNLNIKYIYNEKFDITNSMYSLYLGIKDLKDSTLILESDVFFKKDIFDYNIKGDIVWFVDSNTKNVDGSYVKFNDKNIVVSHEIKRNLQLIDKDDSKSLGMLGLSKKGVSLIKNWLEIAIKQNKQDMYYDLILGEHIDSNNIVANDIKGSKWFEIDNQDDLKKAKEIFK